MLTYMHAMLNCKPHLAALQAGMQYGLMHKLPAQSLHHLHQLTAPATLAHQPYQHPLGQHFTHHHTHAQPAAAAHEEQSQVQRYPVHAQGHAPAAQPVQSQSSAAVHPGQQLHQPGHAQHFPAAQYHIAPAQSAQQEPGQQPAADAAQQESPEGSIELGDDWIEKVGNERCIWYVMFDVIMKCTTAAATCMMPWDTVCCQFPGQGG